MYKLENLEVNLKKLHQLANKDFYKASLDLIFDGKETFKFDKSIGQYTTHVYMRKWDDKRKQNPLTKANLLKQSKTLWKKCRKRDRSVHFQLALERNHYGCSYFYHLHYIVHFSCFSNIASNFKRHIGHHNDTATFFSNNFGGQYARIFGDYGYMDFTSVYDYKGLSNYLNKTTEGLRYINEIEYY